VKVTFDPTSAEDYATFLRVKSLPKYRIIGRSAEFPDEYADAVGLRKPRRRAGDYEPRPGLFDYQRDITALAIARRKFATFVEPGLGKTFIQSEFARHAAKNMPRRRVLMVAPLMVVPQTLEEIGRFYGGSLPVEQIRAADLSSWIASKGGGIGITNYEAMRDETPQGNLGALILDESSVLKSHYGKWGQVVIRLGRGLEWKLAATGTPAPNDRIEFANHAVFLDQFPTVNSFLARFFVNRGETQNRWELKPHALRPFYKALSHWCIFLSDPATYGWKDNAGTLPPIHVHIHDVRLTDRQRELASDKTGTLFGNAGGLMSRVVLSQIAKGNYKGEDIDTAKPAFIRDLIASWPTESTLVWCLYNREQDAIESALPGAASIRGETSYEERARIVSDFKAGRIRTLISKPEILGMGLNLQIATRQVFSGLQDSYEEFFQAVKRSNRVGSTRPLNVHIPITLIERPMIETVLEKSRRVESDTREQESLFKEFGVIRAA
jgi:superfamily II DNA or RNA helicase